MISRGSNIFATIFRANETAAAPAGAAAQAELLLIFAQVYDKISMLSVIVHTRAAEERGGFRGSVL